MASEIHALDYGTELRITVTDDGEIVDLSSASLMEFLIRKPDSSLLTVSVDFYTDGTDGILKYLTTSGDTDIPGLYKIQARVSLGSGVFYSSSSAFKVHCNV